MMMDYSSEQIVGARKKDGLDYVSIGRIYQFRWNDEKNRGKLYNL
jgi:hypothetical protein